MHPACFESQEQFDSWLAADNNTYHYCGTKAGRNTPFCTDCTPSYAAQMRLEGRCEHPEIKFYRSGKAFKGVTDAKPRVKPKIEMDVKWEPIYEQEQPDAALPCTDEGAGISLRDSRTPPA